MGLNVEVVGVTVAGKYNVKNADRLMIGNEVFCDSIHKAVCVLPFKCAVCDGVGGTERGNDAADYVLKSLSKKSSYSIDKTSDMLQILCDINKSLIEEQKNKKIINSMQTTIVGINMYENKVIYYNSGDSRLYRLRGEYLCKLTEDHSTAQEMVNNGMITENIEKELMRCSQITRCLGAEETLPPEIVEISAPPLCGDVYLLCSDGLWGTVDEQKIGLILREDCNLEQKVNELYLAAIDNGSEDDISIVIFRIFD